MNVRNIAPCTAHRMLGKLEGVFCEPASAASVAGVIKHAGNGIFRSGDVVVCTLTGHGLKDPDTALKQVGEPAQVTPSIEKLAEFLELQ